VEERVVAKSVAFVLVHGEPDHELLWVARDQWSTDGETAFA
jgi:hypothetical protein